MQFSGFHNLPALYRASALQDPAGKRGDDETSGNFNHGEVCFDRPALWAHPVIWHIFPASTRLNAFVWPSS